MRNLFITIVLLAGMTAFTGADEQKAQFTQGVVYGSDAAFLITAPRGWILDTASGKSEGLDCVLYPQGETWAKSPVIMYAKIAGAGVTNKDAFVTFAVNSMKKDDPKLIYKKIAEGQSKKGLAYTMVEYIRPTYSHYEQAAYIQLPKAVGFVVYSAFNKKDYHKHKEKLKEVVDTIESTFLYIHNEPK